MPSVRKSTGRVVTPVRQPEVASAKKAQLEPPSVLAFPLPSGLRILVEDDISLLAGPLPRPEQYRAPFEPAPAPPLAASEARLGVPERSPDISTRFPLPMIESAAWPARRPMDDAADATSPLDGLRPRLGPALLEGELAAVAFPAPVRDDQLETIRRLVTGEDFILTSDPGCGTEEVIALALRELLRSGEIRRAVLLAPRALFLYWRRVFGLWAPEVNVVEARAGRIPVGAHLALADPLEPADEPGAPDCDVLVFTGFTAYRRRGGDPSSLRASPGRSRWIVSGGPPSEAEDWRVLHRYLHPQWSGTMALGEVQDRLARQTIRQSKAALTGILPRRSRIEIWLTLDPAQRADYDDALEEERTRLERLGTSVNRTHVLGSLSRLKRIMAFRPGTLDGVKVRVLVDLVEEILASGARVVVVGPSDPIVLDGLMAVLEAYGALRLDSTSPEESQAEVLAEFRHDPRRRVLVADTETRGDGDPLEGASTIIHFGHEWNPAHRRRAEQRLFPDLGPTIPQTVYELWIADSVEARYHALLEAQGLLARDIAHETRPKDIEERLTILEWLSTVFEVGSLPMNSERDDAAGALPGTGGLREAWAGFDAEGLAAATESLMRALGFTQIERLSDPVEAGCDFLGWHTAGQGAMRALIRCVRAPSVVGVEEARRLLHDRERRGDCAGAYLVATTEFTAAARRLADQSEGRLGLVDGAEFHRHLRVLGLVKSA